MKLNKYSMAKLHSIVISGLIGLLLAANVSGCSSVSSVLEPDTVDSSSIPGDPSNFDPMAAYAVVHKAAGENLALGTLDISYVRSDGTLDLNAGGYGAHAIYTFVKEMAAPPTYAPPVGSKGITTGKWYEMAEVDIYHNHMITTKGAVQSIPPMPDPTCSLHTLWSAALEKGAQKDAVAKIFLNADGYQFHIDALKVNLRFDLDCHLKS
jgi:hypothetical protein